MSPSVEPFNEAKYKALMDGLKSAELCVSEIHNNIDFRIDSDFFTVHIKHNETLQYRSIGECLVFAQYGVSKDMNNTGNGYPIFRMNEIHYGLCDISPEKQVDLMPQEFDAVCLKDGDVLFNRTNSYEKVGRTGIYYYHRTPQTFASYLVRLVPDVNTIFPEYLTAFLNTSIGNQEIRRRSRQSINQTNVNLEEVKRIQIPILNKTIQELIKCMYRAADRLRTSALKKYTEAAKDINSILQVNSDKPMSLSYQTKMYSMSFQRTSRLDAEYYQPKYDSLMKSLENKVTVQSICNIYDNSYTPQKGNAYQYIELANVGINGDISDVEYILGENLPTRARRKVAAGQVIVSSVEGSLQSCALVEDEYDGALCSTGFYVLDSDQINSETLLVLFKSAPIQALMKQRCSGTILTAISKDEFLSMPFPMIDETVQQRISENVRESFALRRKSKELLGYAKHAVEMAIEQGEDVALDWLKAQVDQ